MRHAILTSVSALLLAIALAFLIMSVVSAPVTSGLHLASSSTFIYGIFGYCDGTSCPSASYPVSFGDIDSASSWFLGSSARNTLSKIFIVAPIAAGLTFLAFVFTFISLFVYTSALKILSLVFVVISLVSTALIAVIVVLVFHPHVAWLGWLLVAAAGCCLVASPLLFLSITARDTADTDSEEDTPEHKFGALSNMDSRGGFSAGSLNDVKKGQYGYTVDQASTSKEFNYRGTTSTKLGPERTDASNNSLLEATPKVADDVTNTRPFMVNGPGSNTTPYKQNAYTGLNIQSGPNTPIASNKHVAPSLQASGVTASDVEHTGMTAPYPHEDRASSIYNSRKYGVFDHHPTVEGHQPFTELQDTEETAEGVPDSPELLPDSDEESDFTSVSQRPPNEIYSTPEGQMSPQQIQGQNYQHPAQYQAFPPSQGQFNVRPPNQYTGQHVQAFQSPMNQGYVQPVQAERYQPQMQPVSAPRQSNRPTVSDNVLNNNPDFAIGYAGRRKQGARPGFAQHRPNAGPGVAFAPRSGQRDGRYGNT